MQNFEEKYIDADNYCSFLENRGKAHLNYYHYTKWDNMVKILEGKTFMMTKGNAQRLNDHQEFTQKGNADVWEKTAYTSFAYGSTENMAMWGLYGCPPSDAIRLTIPGKMMRKWCKVLCENPNMFKYLNNNFVCDSPQNIILTDVAYVSNKTGILEIHHDDDQFLSAGDNRIDMFPNMTGRCKNLAWEYEKEVRLLLTNQYPILYDSILVDIPQDVLDSIIITTGPSFSENGKNANLILDLRNQGRIIQSNFYGLVHYQSLCDSCIHPFEKKT